MTSSSDNRQAARTRIYVRSECVVFRKTKEKFGGLSNMAAGFPLEVNGVRILTSEALYQACRFPHLPKVQQLIIGQISPMTAKMQSKPYRSQSRPDWFQVRVKIMRWCLRVKLAQNWSRFGELLLHTGDHPIVEESHKDDFWGAKPVDARTLVGTNALGRLLMELRENLKTSDQETLTCVEPLQIPDFLLNDKPISVVTASGTRTSIAVPSPAQLDEPASPRMPQTRQMDIFEQKDSMEVGQKVRRSLIESLKPYSEYRAAGLLWLDKLPVGWQIRRGRGVFECVDVRSKTGNEELLTVSATDGVRRRSEKAVTMFKASSYIGHKLCWPGDLVINSLWAWMRGLGFSKYHGIISTAYGVYRPRTEHRKHWQYFDYLFRSSVYDWELRVRSKGIWSSRYQLTDWSFLDMPVVVPPTKEQDAIVRFLNDANGRIERAIRVKKKLIALLNEQKQTIIHRAVTRGLDPTVPLKPSGIPWLGDIPQHWEKRRIKHCITPIEQGWSPQCDAQPAGDGEWGVLKVGCVNKEHFRDDQNKKLPATLRADLSLEIQNGDILMSRANTRELLGLAALAENPRPKLILCDKLFRFRPLLTIFDGRFLVYCLRCKTSRVQIESSTNGASSSMQNIGQDVLKNIWVSVPPVHEQKQIVTAIAYRTNDLTTAIDRTEREIALLREYRTRLIADVVTGKLDVREAAANLPAPVAESEALTIEAEQDEETEELTELEESNA